ncbi:hypothetical protein OG426_54890 (plasmid) [Streptomyces canus]|uniref:hypothetical protein n=1 Tax=Streptomyces canus TaxID=58343 RepID=UPI002F914B21|nr:hypothetical protein OG426_54890 [Streptomyces canus]
MALPEGPTPPGNVFTEAMLSITDTAKWIIGASAVVAGVLLAGVSLKDVSNLDDEDPLRLVLAAVAVFVALVAVAFVIKRAGDVLTVPDTTISRLSVYEQSERKPPRVPTRPIPTVADYDDVLGYLARLKGEVQPDPACTALSVQELYSQYTDTLHKVDQLRRGREVQVEGRGTVTPNDQEGINLLKEELAVLQGRAALLEDAAQFYFVQKAFTRLKTVMLVSVVAITCATVVFTWTTRSSEVPVGSPIEERFSVSTNRSAVKEAGMRAECAGRTLSAVAIGGTLENPRLMTLSETGCPAAIVDVSDEIGRAIPVPSSK